MSPQNVLMASTLACLQAGFPPSLHRLYLFALECPIEERSVNPHLAITKMSVNSAWPWHALVCTVTALQLRREDPMPLVSSLFVGSLPGGDSVVPSP